jgi:hypothetical protein
MDVDILDYEDEEDESGEESLLVDLLEEEDDWSRNLGGVKEMLNPDGCDPEGPPLGPLLQQQLTLALCRVLLLAKVSVTAR